MSIYKLILRRKMKQSALRAEAFAHGVMFGRSMMVDCFRKVLSDSAVMGRDTFGSARMEKVLNAAFEVYDAQFERQEDKPNE